MKFMRNAILRLIYEKYDQWARQFTVACRPGCSTCCTRNVTITAVEGEEILRYVVREGLEEWLGEKLCRVAPVVQLAAPPLTTNEFAAACLEGREVDGDWPTSREACPFLDENLCRLYPARPFACRLFLSSSLCRPEGEAVVAAAYPGAVTAICQIVEHLGQGQCWGNMIDVLLCLIENPRYKSIARFLPPEKIALARKRVTTAKPLPGFLVDEAEMALLSPVLTAIFQSEINGKTIEDILGGK